MRSGHLVPGPAFPFFINWGHSLIGGRDYGCALSCMRFAHWFAGLFALTGRFLASQRFQRAPVCLKHFWQTSQTTNPCIALYGRVGNPTILTPNMNMGNARFVSNRSPEIGSAALIIGFPCRLVRTKGTLETTIPSSGLFEVGDPPNKTQLDKALGKESSTEQLP